MPENKKIILGLAGEIASGKDTISEYLKEKYGSDTMSFSGPMKRIFDIMHMHPTREEIVWLATDMRERYGQDIWSKVLTEDCKKNPNDLISFPNIRLWEDTEHLGQAGTFYLIAIDSTPEIRYQRLLQRGQNTKDGIKWEQYAGDSTKTWEQFLKESELPTEFPIKEVMKKAEFRIDNNGTFEELYGQVDELINKIYVQK